MADFRLIKEDWNSEILAARRAHPGRLRVICPYIKAPTSSRVLGAAAHGEIEIITRFDLACFKLGVSDLDAIARVVHNQG